MSASREWTVRYLTPNGWESGTNKCDGVGVTSLSPPNDRALTIRVTMSIGFSGPHFDQNIIWQSEDTKEIEDLKLIHGECPERI
jgi:hypothetical protein